MISHRVSVARSLSLRGAGLGNEVIPWAKAYIAARELGLALAYPRWAFNKYRLHKDVGWSRFGLLTSNIASYAASQVLISEGMFRQTGESDYGAAMRVIDGELGLSRRRSVAVVHEGMWGGFLAIRTARAFLNEAVIGAPGVLAFLDSLRLPSDEALVAALHVRLGDFGSEVPGPGEFNRALPLEWYVNSAEQIVESANGRPLRLLVLSNGDRDQLRPLLRLPGVELVSRRPAEGGKAIHDLAAMMTADLLVCSISSFSMLAAFLSGRHYLWYRDQLGRVGQGCGLWGHELMQQRPGAPTLTNAESLASTDHSRGVPVGKDGALPAWLIDSLQDVSAIRRPERDLLTYGVVADSAHRIVLADGNEACSRESRAKE